MKNSILVSVLIFCFSNVFAQNGWERLLFPSHLDESPNAITLVSDNSIGLLTYNGNLNTMELSRLTSTGSQIWKKTIADSLQGAPFSARLINSPNDDLIAILEPFSLVKYDKNGLFVKQVDSANDFGIYFQNAKKTANGIITAHESLITGKVVFSKFDFDLNKIWEKSYSFRTKSQVSFAVNSDENLFFLIGDTLRSDPIKLIQLDSLGDLIAENLIQSISTDLAFIESDMDSLLIYAPYGGDWRIIKTDYSGNFGWSKIISGGNIDLGGFKKLESGDFIFLNRDVNGMRLRKFDSNFNLIWDRFFPVGYPNFPDIIPLETDGGFLFVGGFWQFPVAAPYLIRTDSLGFTFNSQINGKVIADENDNCQADSLERALQNVLVWSKKSGLFQYTDSLGCFTVPVDSGEQVLKIYRPGESWELCADSTIVNTLRYDTVDTEIIMKPIVDCPNMVIDIGTDRLRPCVETTYHVLYGNKGTKEAENVLIEIDFDSNFVVQTTSIPWNSLSGSSFTFLFDTVSVLEYGKIEITGMLSCDLVLNQTLCTEAHIFPDSSCLVPDPIWSGASLEVFADCVNDSIKLSVKNKGTGTMTQDRQYIVIEDAALMRTSNPFQLMPNDTVGESIKANGSTFRIEVPQVNGHPGNSMPSASIEGCGGQPFTTGFLRMFPLNDADNFIDIDCEIVRNSYDPNDKQAAPEGYENSHFIDQNIDLDYKIRFQNTGNDTAYRVVILDTISNLLDITSIRPGVSSHDYDFDIFDNNILRFTFNNINLVDSFANEPSSHGFVKYKISQQTDLLLGSVIKNTADIYFDFNSPIHTNQTFHTVGKDFIFVQTQEILLPNTEVKVYPNPFNESAVLELRNEGLKTEFTCQIFDVNGRLIWSQDSDNQQVKIERGQMETGIYFYKLENSEGAIASGKLIVK